MIELLDFPQEILEHICRFLIDSPTEIFRILPTCKLLCTVLQHLMKTESIDMLNVTWPSISHCYYFNKRLCLPETQPQLPYEQKSIFKIECKLQESPFILEYSIVSQVLASKLPTVFCDTDIECLLFQTPCILFQWVFKDPAQELILTLDQPDDCDASDTFLLTLMYSNESENKGYDWFVDKAVVPGILGMCKALAMTFRFCNLSALALGDTERLRLA